MSARTRCSGGGRTLLVACLAATGFVLAQAALAQQAVTPPGGIQTIEVTDPGGQILSFRHLSGATEVELRGTRLAPNAYSRMKVQSRPGFLEIDINRGEIKGLGPASTHGRDYLTYVLWAVSVDGEPANLGEITFDASGPVSINVTTPYQTFWMMITAEPNFAVNDPSPKVVLYSINQNSTVTSNKALPVPGKLLYHTYYTQYDASSAGAMGGGSNQLLQARKAVELASRAGILAHPTPEGEQPLPDEERTRQTLELARQYLRQAEQHATSSSRPEDAIQFARTAAQIAENARALALGAAGGLRGRQLERERDKAVEEAAAARQLAREREQEIAALQRRLQTLEQAAQATSGEVQRMRDQIAALQRAFQQSVGDLEASRARLRDERDKICGELQRQLARLGQMSEQGGSLALTLASDILFDLNSAELRSSARENLAKVATIRLLLFPEARVRYEGHTDRVGEDAYNQWLSEQRALSVYHYFLEDARALAATAEEQQAAAHRLAVVGELLKMPYSANARRVAARQELMAQLGDAVVGMGERQPVEDTDRASERNRRVVLLFPPAVAGQATSLCQAPNPQ
jgi:outer membrane protein OmpA-like peptidoglycan-associated protein